MHSKDGIVAVKNTFIHIIPASAQRRRASAPPSAQRRRSNDEQGVPANASISPTDTAMDCARRVVSIEGVSAAPVREETTSLLDHVPAAPETAPRSAAQRETASPRDVAPAAASAAVEVIPDRLYWVSLPSVPKSTGKLHYFSIDSRLVYEPFHADFGPLNLGQTIRYCRTMDAVLKDPSLAAKHIVHCCSQEPGKRANAAFLICAYLVIVERKPAEIAYEPFRCVHPQFLAFRDAIRGPCTFQNTILDCLRGLETAIQLGWLDWAHFDVKGYEFHQKVDNGDMNLISP